MEGCIRGALFCAPEAASWHLQWASPYVRLLGAAQAAAGVRRPGSLRDPTRPAGAPTARLPFDHIVVVMMENHSFDNYLGMLPRRGQPLADGFRERLEGDSAP